MHKKERRAGEAWEGLIFKLPSLQRGSRGLTWEIVYVVLDNRGHLKLLDLWAPTPEVQHQNYDTNFEDLCSISVPGQEDNEVHRLEAAHCVDGWTASVAGSA